MVIPRFGGRFICALAVTSLIASALTVVQVLAGPNAFADASPAPSNVSQLITVNAPTSGSTTATLTGWQRGADGVWRVTIAPVPAKVGGTGIGPASEGSQHTPAGTFALTQAFGRQAEPGTKMPYFRTDALDWWDENSASPTYNLHVRRSISPGAASENLYYSGSVYDYVVNMNYNMARVPGAGSAFFLHVTNGTPTAGCVAVQRATMVAILRWLDPARHPYISIKVGAAWRPPDPSVPVGRVESTKSTAPRKITVVGWAFDPATPGSAKVDVTVSGPAGSDTSRVTTGLARPDIARTYSWAGGRSGYQAVVGAKGLGVNVVCVAIVSVRATVRLGCRNVLVRNSFGRLDSVSVAGSVVTAVGWALNPNMPSSRVPIRIRDLGVISQVLGDFRAAASRPDVAKLYPGYDANHGFRIAITAKSRGTHLVCALALPQYGGWDGPTIGCKSVVVP